ncbi:MAG: OmpA family protein [Cyclobacteriaceae bacterium]
MMNQPKLSGLARAIVLGAVIILIQNNAFAQKEDKVYANAMDAFYDEAFADAIQLFSEVQELNPKFKKNDVTYRLEISQLLLKENRERPLNDMLAFRETSGKRDKFYHYWMGRVYANKYMFPEAVESWRKFLGQKAYKSEEIVEETKDFIKETETLVAFFDNPDNYEVHPLEAPINTKFSEMSPVYFEDKQELLYASAHGSRNDVFRIFHSTRQDYSWSPPTEVSSLGRFSKSNANIEVVNEDGKLFIFNEKKDALYFSEPNGNGWSEPQEFDSHLSSKNLASHFYINTHEDRIIFVSKEKKNGLDLHESFKDANSGKWSKPTQFASAINSPWDEESPYLSPDEKKLYFSSNKPGGIGGFDVYVSEFDESTNTWKEPVNMGWPINSPDDDMHFKMNDNLESGYFVSNRIYSQGDYDIFFFWEIEKAFIEGRVLNALTEEIITSGEIRFHPSQYLMEYFRSPIDENGKFRTEIISDEAYRVEIISGIDTLGVETYEVHDSKGEAITHFQDFYAYSKNATPEEMAAFEQKIAQIKAEKPKPAEPTTKLEPTPVIKELEEIPEEEKFVVDEKAQPEETEEVENLGSKYRVSNKSILRNIYFDFGTAQLTTESNETLNILYQTLKANPSMKIEIGGHTDNVGKPDVNQWLSENRAKAVRKWLVKKGIDPKRMTAKGYGESNPLASNDDELNGRELNRRIEILVIE